MSTMKWKRNIHNNQKEYLERAQDRAAVWRKAKGMWKDREPDPITELNKMREEWEERLQEQEKIWRASREKEKKQN